MALADTARLVASLELQDKFSKTADKFDSRIGRMDQHLKTFGRNVAIAGVAGLGFLAANVTRGVQSLIELENVTTATNAVIESTGGAAGISAEKVRELAEEYETLNATMDDKVLQSAENLLLTFPDITEKAFEPALEAALNLNQALGGGEEGLQGVILQVGKALQDPVRGLTALRRSGVSFTAAQQKQIKALVEANDLYGAQQIILGELSRQFGGQFAAAGDTAAGRFARFQDVIEDTQMQLASAFLPVLERVSDELTTFLADPSTQSAVRELGSNLADAFDSIVDIAGDLPWGAIGDAFRLMGTGSKALLDAFTQLPPWVQTAVLTGWGLNKLTGGGLGTIVSTLASGLIKGILGINAGVVNINAATVNGGGGVAGGKGGGIGGVVGGIVGTAGIAAAISGGFLALNDLLTGGEAGAERGAVAVTGGPGGLIGRAIEEAVGDPFRLFADTSERQNADQAERLDKLRSDQGTGFSSIARVAERANEQRRQDDAFRLRAAHNADLARRSEAINALREQSQANMKLQQIADKDFSPRVSVSVTSNVTISDIQRKITSQQIAIGKGPLERE